MNRIVNSLCHRISPALYKWANLKIKRNFTASTEEIDIVKRELLYSHSSNQHKFIYKDENWNQIRYIGHYMWNDLFKASYFKSKNSSIFIDNDCENTKVEFTDKDIICKSKGKKDDWIYLKFLDTVRTPYLVEFETKIMTETTEFQFAFFYKSIGERYRFNLINNKKLNFDVVHGGFFHNHLLSVPLTLELNRLYKFEIAITEERFTYIIDGKVIMSVRQDKKILDNGQFVLILWDNANSNIDTQYCNINVYNIHSK